MLAVELHFVLQYPSFQCQTQSSTFVILVPSKFNFILCMRYICTEIYIIIYKMRKVDFDV